MSSVFLCLFLYCVLFVFICFGADYKGCVRDQPGWPVPKGSFILDFWMNRKYVCICVYSYFEKGCRIKCARQLRKVLWVVFEFIVFQGNLKEYTVFTNGGHAGKNWGLVMKARRWRVNKNCK